MASKANDRDVITATDNQYFFDFQNVLERKEITLRKLDEIKRKFDFRDHFTYSWFRPLWRKISQTKLKILSNLADNNTRIFHQGDYYILGDVMDLDPLPNLMESHLQNFDLHFQAYLEGHLGYLTKKQLVELDELHRTLNEELHELFGSMEYNRMSGS